MGALLVGAVCRAIKPPKNDNYDKGYAVEGGQRTVLERDEGPASEQAGVPRTVGEIRRGAFATPTGTEELLRLVHKHLPSTDRVTPAVVGAAVAAVLNPAPDTEGKYPEAALEKIVPWWGDFLDAARPGAGQSEEAAEALHELALQVLGYCIDGYETGVLPLPADV